MNTTSLYTSGRPPRFPKWAAAFLAAPLLAGCALVHDNFRVVDPGRFYRSGQMSAARLERVIARYGVRTVINLRGAAPPEAWYREEVAVCHTLGVAHHDLAWSMDTLPDPDSLAQFVSWCEHAEKPILAHCQGGTHRGGVGAAVYLLTQGATVEEARLQFGPFFHNAPIGILLDLYATDEHDASLPFAEWLRTRYPAIYRAARAPSLR